MTPPAAASAAYRACIKEAAAQGRDLMARAVQRVEDSLAERVQRAPDGAERQAVHEAIGLLHKHKVPLVAAYPQALLAEFGQAISGGGGPRGGAAALSFAELELVDDAKVQESVEVVRTQQAVASAVDGELVHLNALVCAAQGLRTVQSDRNPLRPEVYVRSLRKVVQESPVPAPVRLRWLQLLGDALGPELAVAYRGLTAFLRAQGVNEAGFQIVAGATARGSDAAGGSMPGLAGGGATPGGPGGRQQVSTLLTVRALQRLLAGELEVPEGPVTVGPNGTPLREPPPPGFDETVPAAFEVLQEMRQVESVMQRLRRRDAAGTGGTAPLRERLRGEVHRPGQALALEVVSLMVENIAGDQRLLPPVREAVRQLEPALLRLSLADPRFFTERHHPARRLLDELTSRSMAWQDEQEPGWEAFIGPLREAVEALVETHVEGAEPYEFALQTLQETWNRGQTRERRQREKAVRALLHAEQRSLLAARIAAEIEGRADLALAPAEVVAFLVGPWAQVMAQAQLSDASAEADPGGVRALVPELLWSVLPHTTAAAAQRLARRLPVLLETLRTGLASIGYAQVQIRRFLDRLALLHQRALKGQPVEPPGPDARAQGVAELERLLGPAPTQADSWLAPSEAQQTGYLDSLPGAERPLYAATERGGLDASTAPTALGAGDADLPLSLQPGSWVEMQEDGHWARWQVWLSPHRTLLMLSGPGGRTHSMSPKLAAAMLESGAMRAVTASDVVDQALDAVAGAALRNDASFRP